MTRIAPHVAVDSRERLAVLTEAIDAMRAVSAPERLESMLSELAPLLPADLLDAAVALLPAIQDQDFQALAAALLAQSLPESERTPAVARANRLAAAAPQGRARTFALGETFGHLNETDKADVVPILLRSIRETKGEDVDMLLSTFARVVPERLSGSRCRSCARRATSVFRHGR